MKITEYTIKEIRTLVDSMSGMYDLVRVVDPIECRILKFDQNGSFTMNEKCYGVWLGDQRCMNCTSAAACRTGCHQMKKERFENNIYHIQSNPVRLKLNDGGIYDAVVEMISVREDTDSPEDIGTNDRAAEDVDEKGLRYMALYDSLTRTLKAETFYERAREVLTELSDEHWTMIIGDIAEFNLINSLFGIEKGNEALRLVAARLRKIAADGEGICGRLYGDKFAVLLPSRNYSERAFAQAVRDMDEVFGDEKFTLRIHLGVYEKIDPDIPVSVMCDRANMALKKIRSDYSVFAAYFDDMIMKKSIADYAVISGFNTALREGQFRMYLQPLTDKDGNAFGAEALARWIRPDGTVLGPAAFIDTLEQTGLIQELDIFIWEQAVKQLSKWTGTDKEHLSISVNMSAKDLYCLDLMQIFTELTKKYGVDNSRLRLEITESAVIEKPETSYRVISQLREAGFVVEIDDFGKGESSLSLLKDIHADILKIDRGFLRETDDISRSKVILRAVISMASELGMKVIAEGVETERQLKALVEMGCEYFQGYYFSQPVSQEEFEAKY